MRVKTLLVMLTAAVVLSSCGKKDEQAVAETKKAAVPVRIATLEMRTFEERVRVQGTLEAKNYANVSSRLDGTLEEIWVDKGDKVEAGKTKLFVTDKINRERAVESARQAVAAQRQNLKVAAANVEKVKVELKKAELDKDRYVRLRALGSATANELELYTTQYDQARAGLKYAEASEGAVKEQVKAAEIALAITEKDLSDCLVMAPISGVVSNRMKEPGEQGSKGGVVLRIEDLTKLEAVAYIPGQYYSRVTAGSTKLRVSIDGKLAGEYTVTYRSPVIDPKLRTFEVKALMPGDLNKGLVPGAMADITIVLASRESLAVPTHSILTRSRGTMIYLAENNRAVPCGVKCGIENEGWTEIEPAPLAEGAAVPKEGAAAVAEGQFLISDNDEIAIQE